MATTGVPRSAVRSRWPIWVPPLLWALAGAPIGVLLARFSGPTWAWPGDVDSARGVEQAISTSVMAATALTFSLRIVGVQLASQQFSPRLLREFARDPVTKRVLSVLATTFASP